MNATKRIISIVLVIATMMCIAIPAIAAEEEVVTKETNVLLANSAEFALTQHAEDTATEAKKWDGDADTYTDENGTDWKYVYGRNYIVSDDNYLYRELADGTIAIIYDPVAEDVNGEVIIPSKLDGKDVSKIDAYAFYCRIDITGIRIPDSVKVVGYRAFAYCSAIERIVIGNGVEIFNQQATDGFRPVICFTGTEADADKIIVWDRDKVNAKTSFVWTDLAKIGQQDELTVMYEVDTKKLEDTTTEYNLFVWFFKVYLKSFFDNFIALAKANFDGLVILFKGSSKAE
ncbi:MAG: leucine-rich repeat protein [Clostridia bacterium]|nr:leucine-rich repeat protein [Clostridia bacterium]